jgi:anti-anti-sigma factor
VFPWLSVDARDEDAVWVRVTGGVAADRSDELWDALEAAFDQCEGRLVVIDLSAVSTFDASTIATLSTVSRQAARWHMAVCAVVQPTSPLAQYLHYSGLGEFLTVRPTVADVRASLRYTEIAELPPAVSPWFH